MTANRASERRSGIWPLGLVLGLALACGILVLPYLGKRLDTRVAPDFALPVIHGGERGARVRLSEQRGRPVLLDFWASWCQPCRDQAAAIERVRAAFPELVVVGVNVSDSPEAAARYLAAEDPPWLVLADADGSANLAYGVETLPTLVVIDAAGNQVAVRRRFVPERELRALLTDVLE